MFNRATLIGNLGADPEMRTLADGRPVANLRIATSERWKDKATGERKEKTEWHRVVCFNEGLCGVISQYLHKGDKVMIEGKIQTRKWQNKDGADQYSTEIVLQGFDAHLIMLSTRNGNGTEDAKPSEASKPAGRQAAKPAPKSLKDDMDDEIPF